MKNKIKQISFTADSLHDVCRKVDEFLQYMTAEELISVQYVIQNDSSSYRTAFGIIIYKEQTTKDKDKTTISTIQQ